MLFLGVLSTVSVDGVRVLVNQFADGNESEASIFQGGKNQGKRLGGVQSVVVAKNDRAGLCAVDDAHGDLRSGEVFHRLYLCLCR